MTTTRRLRPVGIQANTAGEAVACLISQESSSPARPGWAEAARDIAEAGDDSLVMGEFGNSTDADLNW